MTDRVLFRVDASHEIGTGHVMRCLTLADALASGGSDCRFLMRDLPGHLAAVVAAHGHAVRMLPRPSGSPCPNVEDPAHAAWLGVPWWQDATETAGLAGNPTWIVADSYALDCRWQCNARFRAHAGHRRSRRSTSSRRSPRGSGVLARRGRLPSAGAGVHRSGRPSLSPPATGVCPGPAARPHPEGGGSHVSPPSGGGLPSWAPASMPSTRGRS